MRCSRSRSYVALLALAAIIGAPVVRRGFSAWSASCRADLHRPAEGLGFNGQPAGGGHPAAAVAGRGRATIGTCPARAATHRPTASKVGAGRPAGPLPRYSAGGTADGGSLGRGPGTGLPMIALGGGRRHRRPPGWQGRPAQNRHGSGRGGSFAAISTLLARPSAAVPPSRPCSPGRWAAWRCRTCRGCRWCTASPWASAR